MKLENQGAFDYNNRNLYRAQRDNTVLRSAYTLYSAAGDDIVPLWQPRRHRPMSTKNGQQRDGQVERGTYAVKAGLAQMLKGGVIMDVVTADQARIAEEAGACAVMALERVPADIRKEWRCGAHERPATDQRDHGSGHNSSDGQGADRPLCRSTDPGSAWRRLY